MKSIMRQFYKMNVHKIILFVILLIAVAKTFAQMGIGVDTPNASAELEVYSKNKGFLPPRMTATQRNAIVSPVAGLMVWCSNCGVAGELQVFNGTTWRTIAGETASMQSVMIGTQDWMPRNLDVATYRNGDPIPQVTDPAQWANLTTGAWCYYNNDPVTGAMYGKMYNWYAVNDPRGLAPAGWRIPNDSDFGTLKENLGGEPVAGGKIKETGTTHWNSPNTGASDIFGFTALPGGSRFDFDGSFHDIGLKSFWWSATELSADVVSGHWLRHDDAALSSLYFYRRSGFSVRCIRDQALPTILIGAQIWSAKNLDVTTYRNGEPIPQVTNPTQWANLTTGAWCYYNNDPATGAVYGKMYNWYAVHDPRGLAPAGWHIPNDAEWTILNNYLGGETVAGGKIKEAGTTHWNSPNTGATNSSGFTGLPVGSRFNTNGSFHDLGLKSFWWSSTELSPDFVSGHWLRHDDASFSTLYFYRSSGFSVRCIKD